MSVQVSDVDYVREELGQPGGMRACAAGGLGSAFEAAGVARSSKPPSCLLAKVL